MNSIWSHAGAPSTTRWTCSIIATRAPCSYVWAQPDTCSTSTTWIPCSHSRPSSVKMVSERMRRAAFWIRWWMWMNLRLPGERAWRWGRRGSWGTNLLPALWSLGTRWRSFSMGRMKGERSGLGRPGWGYRVWEGRLEGGRWGSWAGYGCMLGGRRRRKEGERSFSTLDLWWFRGQGWDIFAAGFNETVQASLNFEVPVHT